MEQLVESLKTSLFETRRECEELFQKYVKLNIEYAKLADKTAELLEKYNSLKKKVVDS